MKFTVNKVTARPFLVPHPGPGDEPPITVIAHVYHTSLDDVRARTRRLPRPGFLACWLRPADRLGILVQVSNPSGRSFEARCRFKKGQFPDVLDLIFPSGTTARDLVDGCTIEARRYDWITDEPA